MVSYSPSYDESGRTLAAAVTGARSTPDSSLGRTLVLVVGTDYTGVHAVSAPTATSTDLPRTAAVQTAAGTGCF